MTAEHVMVVDYRPHWRERFAQEQARILAAATDLIPQIEHIGSTSVVGLAAKPVIDMMPGVPSLAAFDAANGPARLAELGYTYRPDYEDTLPERRYFIQGTDNPEHPEGRWFQVHLVELGGAFWRRHLAFRDYLRTHPAERDAYGAFKQQIAPDHATTHTYADAKDAFVKEMEARAMAWAGGRKSG